MGNLEISHDILLAGSDFATCRIRVAHFFDRTTLIRYDEVRVSESESVNGTDVEFLPRIKDGFAANLKVVRELLQNLREEGFETVDDLQDLNKGYLSNILHTIAHMQDGFIGVDSRFYNLEEDSHSVSRDLQQKIAATPESFWIVRVTGKIASSGEDPLDGLRTFEWKAR